MKLLQTDAFKRWWDADWSWRGLAARSTDGTTFQDVWRSEESRLIPFGTGNDGRQRLWTYAHLPPCDPQGNMFPPDQFQELKRAALPDIYERLATGRTSGKIIADGQGDRGVPPNLMGVVFPEEFNFDSEETVAQFHSAIFLGSLDFKGHFDSGFTDAIFCGEISPAYMSTEGEGSLDSYATFGGRTGFKGAAFLGYAGFNNARFLNGVSFEDAIFCSYAIFSGAKFRRYSNFNNVKFECRASFSLAEFDGSLPSNFEGCWFHDKVEFPFANFHGGGLFRRARFSADADFRGAEFGGVALFDAPKNHSFDFAGEMNFSQARFRRAADFRGREFLARTDFSHAAFAEPPLFHGVTLFPETNFDLKSFRVQSAVQRGADGLFYRAETGRWLERERLRRAGQDAEADGPGRLERWQRFLVAHRPPFALWWPGMRPIREAVDAEMYGDELAYRTLRLQFAALQNTEHEMMFYGLELEARRKRPSVPFLFEGLFSWLFKLTSNYGQETLRPVLCFCAIWLAGIAVLVATWSVLHGSLPFQLADALPDSADWILRRLIPLPIWDARDTPQWIAVVGVRAPGLIAFLRLFLPMTSIGLLTVFLIALRRRFQIDRG